ncbi:hypothetical protein NL526_30110, partial [Klebsiella pneumoniae]|nr:hypothetical protein [Klebsiella pneumoniae]
MFNLYKVHNGHLKLVDEVDAKRLDIKNWILASNADLDRLHFLETRGTPLKDFAEIHVGITTLADEYYIFKDPKFN